MLSHHRTDDVPEEYEDELRRCGLSAPVAGLHMNPNEGALALGSGYSSSQTHSHKTSTLPPVLVVSQPIPVVVAMMVVDVCICNTSLPYLVQEVPQAGKRQGFGILLD